MIMLNVVVCNKTKGFCLFCLPESNRPVGSSITQRFRTSCVPQLTPVFILVHYGTQEVLKLQDIQKQSNSGVGNAATSDIKLKKAENWILPATQ